MNRQIKFRAWDIQLNVMIYAKNEVIFYPPYSAQRIKLLFTGLCDKNGKEIYEGDRIEFTFFYYGETEVEKQKIGTIEFDGLSFIFKIDEEEYYAMSELQFDSESDIEVIGNIYENPELLGEKVSA